MSFLYRNRWGFLFLAAFVGCVVACFSVPPAFFWWAILGSFGTALSGIYCFLYPPEPKPFVRHYVHEDWDFGDQTEFPRLTIPMSVHGMGRTPHLEFQQGDFVFPWHVEPNGDIVVIRNNHSIGRFKDMEFIVRRTKT